VLLAALQADSRDLAGAEATLQKAMSLNPNDDNAAMLFTRVAVIRGTVERSIAVWQDRVAKHPDDVRAYILLGMLEEGRNNRTLAQTHYQNALKIKPDQPLAANNLAYLMLSTGQNVDTALSLAQIARQGMPDSPNSADTLAWAYYHKGVYQLATDLLEQALKTQPNNATYHYHLGLAYQKMSDTAKAKTHLEKALQLAPNSPDAGEVRKALNEVTRG